MTSHFVSELFSVVCTNRAGEPTLEVIEMAGLCNQAIHRMADEQAIGELLRQFPKGEVTRMVKVWGENWATGEPESVGLTSEVIENEFSQRVRNKMAKIITWLRKLRTERKAACVEFLGRPTDEEVVLIHLKNTVLKKDTEQFTLGEVRNKLGWLKNPPQVGFIDVIENSITEGDEVRLRQFRAEYSFTAELMLSYVEKPESVMWEKKKVWKTLGWIDHAPEPEAATLSAFAQAFAKCK